MEDKLVILRFLFYNFLDPNESAPKWHLDRFSRFCRAHSRDEHTDEQTTLRVTAVAIGRIYAMLVSRCTAYPFNYTAEATPAACAVL